MASGVATTAAGKVLIYQQEVQAAQADETAARAAADQARRDAVDARAKALKAKSGVNPESAQPLKSKQLKALERGYNETAQRMEDAAKQAEGRATDAATRKKTAQSQLESAGNAQVAVAEQQGKEAGALQYKTIGASVVGATVGLAAASSALGIPTAQLRKAAAELTNTIPKIDPKTAEGRAAAIRVRAIVDSVKATHADTPAKYAGAKFAGGIAAVMGASSFAFQVAAEKYRKDGNEAAAAVFDVLSTADRVAAGVVAIGAAKSAVTGTKPSVTDLAKIKEAETVIAGSKKSAANDDAVKRAKDQAKQAKAQAAAAARAEAAAKKQAAEAIRQAKRTETAAKREVKNTESRVRAQISAEDKAARAEQRQLDKARQQGFKAGAAQATVHAQASAKIADASAKVQGRAGRAAVAQAASAGTARGMLSAGAAAVKAKAALEAPAQKPAARIVKPTPPPMVNPAAVGTATKVASQGAATIGRVASAAPKVGGRLGLAVAIGAALASTVSTMSAASAADRQPYQKTDGTATQGTAAQIRRWETQKR